MLKLSDQLEIFGFDETIRRAQAEAATAHERARLVRRVETTHELMSELPSPEDLSFLHSGLCQTCLPHSRPEEDHSIWSRRAGRFSLLVQPGAVGTPDGPRYVGVPYGPKARLIMIHLQTEGMKSRSVNLGGSLSAFMRSLGLAVTGGKRGTIGAVREQALRIAQCRFTLQWDGSDESGGHTILQNAGIADRLEFWQSGEWSETIELSERFHAHLREHAVPLDKRGIAHLSANSLGLDLYALFAYRLPRLGRPVHLRWKMLQQQIGANEANMRTLAQRVRDVMADVFTAYPHAKVDITRNGMLMHPSRPAVPRTLIRGATLIEAAG